MVWKGAQKEDSERVLSNERRGVVFDGFVLFLNEQLHSIQKPGKRCPRRMLRRSALQDFSLRDLGKAA